MKIMGDWKTRNVWIDGKYLDPIKSQQIRNHSPDGHFWSYGGSGPSQLALSILLCHFPKEIALKWYQDFKWDVIATLPKSDFQIEIDLDKWIKKQELKNEKRQNN